MTSNARTAGPPSSLRPSRDLNLIHPGPREGANDNCADGAMRALTAAADELAQPHLPAGLANPANWWLP